MSDREWIETSNVLAVGVVELDEFDKDNESSIWGIGGKDLMRLWYSSSAKYSSYSNICIIRGNVAAQSR